jgi:glycosyltransferase involved in cell wall biosynthesis
MNIAIISPLKSLDPSYSVAGVIKNQCSVLSKFHHNVTLIVDEEYSGPGLGLQGVSLLKILPSSTLIDYKSKLTLSKEHEELANSIALVLSARLSNFDVVFTHDLIFTGWMLPYALSIMVLAEEHPDLSWFHWIHSDPCVQSPKDWWNMNHYNSNHTIVYPAIQTLSEISKVFNTDKVINIPHILDLKQICRFSDQTKDIVDLLPALQTSDIIQISPISTDRLNSKGARELINLFGLLKKSGRSVCLVIANQFSGRREAQLVDPIYYYEKVARRCGLEPYTDFIFTSELFNGKYKEGIPQRTLFELMSLSNLFVMPSKSESFGLGLLEAMMASGVIVVANEHLKLPIKQYTSFDFKAVNAVDQNININDMAPLVDWIIEQLESNSVVKARTEIRKNFNPLTIYNTYYKPLFASLQVQAYRSNPLPKSLQNIEV